MSERDSMARRLGTGNAKIAASLIAALCLCAPAMQSRADAPNPSMTSRRSAPAPGHAVSSSPVKSGSRLTSRFGMRQGRRSKRRVFHAGIDFHAKKGDPVFAARAGVVDIVADNKSRRPGFRGYGNAVVVYHPGEDVWSFYAHLDTVAVQRGQTVEAGETVGTAGNTSNGKFKGMGVHLHFEVRTRTRKGRRPFPGAYRVNNMDPEKWLASHGVMYDEKGRLITGPPRVARNFAKPSPAATGGNSVPFMGRSKRGVPRFAGLSPVLRFRPVAAMKPHLA